MTSNPPRLDPGLAREILVVSALTAVGAAIRLWSLGRLGLIHFDEGVYALAGLWIFSPRGLAGIDPTVISYAPPGFPVLVGLSYVALGVGDVAAILVSIGSGTLTIPVAAWLSRRTFGPGAGGAAAAFAALSGPHVAFSRMALTDVSFLLFWVIAIGQGQRFLERPNPARAVWLGLAVGMAQLFKYNGWISGVIVAASAVIWLFLHPDEWRKSSTVATWGWGLFAAIVAAIVYWPWFQFVQSHGGYGALLAHERSYLGGLASWPGHLSLQLDQATALGGGPIWLVCGGLAASAGMLISVGDLAIERRFLPRILIDVLSITALYLTPELAWWVALAWISIALFWRCGVGTKSAYVLFVGWATLSLLTPFYHPYARLWLPVEAFGWLLLSGVVVGIRSRIEVSGRGARWTCSRASDLLPWFALICILSAVLGALSTNSPWKTRHLGLLEPSDSLRQACRSIMSELPKDLSDLRVFARPPLAYYLAVAGHVGVHRQPDLAHLIEKRDPRSWAVLDMALIRQQNVSKLDLDRSLAGWLVAREIPTTLNPPTLFDIDPAAARGGTIDASAPVWLLRPRRMEDVR
jgi:dolichyl-phosphate-mannose-protein mannosyltransferase